MFSITGSVVVNTGVLIHQTWGYWSVTLSSYLTHAGLQLLCYEILPTQELVITLENRRPGPTQISRYDALVTLCMPPGELFITWKCHHQAVLLAHELDMTMF